MFNGQDKLLKVYYRYNYKTTNFFLILKYQWLFNMQGWLS